MSFWIKICPECEEGRLIVAKKEDISGLFLVCEECENSWQSPSNVGVATESFPLGEKEVKDATIEDIRNAGWDKYKIIEDANVPFDFDPLTYWA
ncbi:MAG: hypothetical protein QM647_04430 [Asticcacaulis sp.]|uniref:hypothetical protein n=1 Tax=Asticcacaulis sp. TaxID=1872648 RepID=UPI0039E320F7